MPKAKGEKKIKILIEFPERWVDPDDPVLGLGDFFHQRIGQKVEEEIAEKVAKEVDVSSIKVSKKAIEKRIVSILAERALDGNAEI